MNRPAASLAAILFLLPTVCPAGAQNRPTPPLPLPQHAAESTSRATEPIGDYIRQAWNTLSRSTRDCKSLADPKVAAAPVLYLPAGAPMPADVTRLREECKVRIERLPRPIHRLGDVSQNEIPVPGLLYLPNEYVVPGGRFNEMFGWDSYFIILGLLHDGRIGLAHGMVENFFYEIEHYGAVLNANRTYFLTRSQPPLLSSMIRAVYEAELASDPSPENRARQKAWLARAYGFAVRDHDFWLQSFHQAGSTGLARYFDVGEGPVPEMADDSHYYIDVIHWLVTHPEVHTTYLIAAPEHPSPATEDALARTSCDLRASVVCAHAWSDGYRLTRDFYEGDRAVRESGFDVTFRFGPFSGSTHHYAPVCLNSLLYQYERNLEHFARLLGKPEDAARWSQEAAARKAAIDKYLWNPKKGMFFDYDFTTGRQSDYDYATTFYPLWAGLATPRQAAAVERNLGVFNRPGGLACSAYASGLQWDLPFGWAPLNYFAMEGLERYGDLKDARRIANEFAGTVAANYQRDGTIREKYNVLTRSSDVNVMAGYRENVVGFGWTNGVYLVMESLLHPDARRPLQPPGKSGALQHK